MERDLKSDFNTSTDTYSKVATVPIRHAGYISRRRMEARGR